MQKSKYHSSQRERSNSLDVKLTKLANFHVYDRIHVERVIGVLRQKYTILQSTLPINIIMCDDTTETSMIDKIVVICCALCNFCDPVVPCDFFEF